MEITDVEASSTATSPSHAQRQEPRQSSMPPSIPSSRKRKSATKTTNDPKKKPPKEVMQRSWVWNHVSKCTIKEVKEVMKEGKMQKVEVEVLKAKCNYCGQLFACDPSASGTSTYSKHIRQVCKKYVRNDEIHQKVLGSSTSFISASVVGPQKNEKNKLTSIDTSYSSQSQRCSAPTETPLIFDEMMDDWEKELEDTQDVVPAHEVDRYLLDRLEICNKREMFDILKWWKLKGLNAYPTLVLVAKDVLAIQVSTVASESAFSTEGRVIDAFRSSLTPKSVETLICLQNWLRNEDIDISNIEYEASEAEIDFYQECEIEHEKSLETIPSQKDKDKGVVIL